MQGRPLRGPVIKREGATVENSIPWDAIHSLKMWFIDEMSED